MRQVIIAIALALMSFATALNAQTTSPTTAQDCRFTCAARNDVCHERCGYYSPVNLIDRTFCDKACGSEFNGCKSICFMKPQ
jgi:hypothetical protein